MRKLQLPEHNEYVPAAAPPIETEDMNMLELERLERTFNEKADGPSGVDTSEPDATSAPGGIKPVITLEASVTREAAVELVTEQLTKHEHGSVPVPPDPSLVNQLVFQMTLNSNPPAVAQGPSQVDFYCYLCTMARHLRKRLPRAYVDRKTEELIGASTETDHGLKTRSGGLMQQYERAAQKYMDASLPSLAAAQNTKAMVTARKQALLRQMNMTVLPRCPCSDVPPDFDLVSLQPE